jgi:hypothetical protein
MAVARAGRAQHTKKIVIENRRYSRWLTGSVVNADIPRIQGASRVSALSVRVRTALRKSKHQKQVSWF